jgi:hypothetical protein
MQQSHVVQHRRQGMANVVKIAGGSLEQQAQTAEIGYRLRRRWIASYR